MNNRPTLLLVGASGGVGKAIMNDLAKAGFNLALHYLSDDEALKAQQQELQALGAEVMLVKANITQEAEVEAMIQGVENHFGSIDVLLNNAGVTKSGMTWKLGADVWDETIAVNLTGPFLCIKHVLKGMRERGFGRIISMTSVVAQTGVAGTSAYAASKAGLIGMTKSIAKEVANKDITVNCISLGYFDAGMLYEIPEPLRESIRQTIPRQSFGKPEAISKTVVYLSSKESHYITGQTINLNGGLH